MNVLLRLIAAPVVFAAAAILTVPDVIKWIWGGRDNLD